MKNMKEVEGKTYKKRELTKLEKFIDFFDKNRKIFYGFIGGALVTAIVATIIWPDRIATLKDGTQPVATVDGKNVTADTLYESLKKNNDVTNLLDIVDAMLLTDMYEEDDEMKTDVEETADNYYKQVESYYQMSKEDFLAQYGFESHDEFVEDLKLNYRRTKYFDEYVKSLISDKEIEDYYNEHVYGDINSKHLLVLVDENMGDEDAKKLAEEIIGKLNEGKSFDEVKEEYKDKTTYEDLGFQGFSSNIQDSYMNALKELEDGKYTTEPVKTSYGYHVIYRIEQKEKAKLEDVKDLILDVLMTAKKEEDKYLSSKALAHLREEKGFTFADTVIEDKYKKYLKSIEEAKE